MERFAFNLVDEDRLVPCSSLVRSAPSEVLVTRELAELSSLGVVPLPFDLPVEWERNPFRVNIADQAESEEDGDEDVEFYDDEEDVEDDVEDEDDDEDLDDEDLDDEELDDEDLDDDFDDEDLDDDLDEDDEDL